MGEAKRRTQTAMSVITQAVGVEVPNGRLQVRWDGQSAAPPFGQMALFLEFLQPHRPVRTLAGGVPVTLFRPPWLET